MYMKIIASETSWNFSKCEIIMEIIACSRVLVVDAYELEVLTR